MADETDTIVAGEKSDRLFAGIEGFDELIGGGIPRGHFLLVNGAPGTGKTIFSFQFLYEGARKYGEPGVYISLEETPDNIVKHMKEIGMSDVDELIKQKKLKVVRSMIFNFNELKEGIKKLIVEYKAKRVVIDSTAVLSLFFESPLQTRLGIVELMNFLRPLGASSSHQKSRKRGRSLMTWNSTLQTG